MTTLSRPHQTPHQHLGRRSFLSLLTASAAVAGLPPALAAADPRSRRRQDTRKVAEVLAAMSLSEKVGQLFIPYVYGADAHTVDARNTSVYGVGSIAEIIEKFKIGGVIYFGWSDNLDDPEQVARLSNGIQAASLALPAKIPALVSIDQEQGVVVRLPQPSTQLAGAMALGATGSTRLARLAARVTGAELHAVGVNQNYAPLGDVNVNALNPVIGVRSFGGDPTLVSDLVEAQIDGFHRARMLSTVKHFPGHGDTGVDSHVGLPIINHTREEIERLDLPPFRAAIAAKIDAVMTAHIVLPAIDPSERPSTLSHPILTGLLREELGFTGVIVTDSLLMEGVRQMFDDDRVPVEAIKAGADQMLMPPDLGVAIDGVLAAVDSGEITEERLDASVSRILEMKMGRGLFDDSTVDVAAVGRSLDTRAHHTISNQIGDKSVTLLENKENLLPLTSGTSVLVTGWGASTVPTLATALTAVGLPGTAAGAAEPNATKIAEVVAAADDHDVVIVVTQSSAFGVSTPQQNLVQALVDSDTPVITVAVRNPYDIVHHAAPQAALATYGYADVSLQALARVVSGAVNPSGKLPVVIPEPDGTGARYDLGFGLTF